MTDGLDTFPGSRVTGGRWRGWIWTCWILLLASAGCKSAGDPQRIRIPGPIVPFAFCYGRMPPDQAITQTETAGFHGLVPTRSIPAEIRAYASDPRIESGRFRVPATLLWIRAWDPVDSSALLPMLRDLHAMDAMVWLVVSGRGKGDKSTPTMERAMETMASVAELCRREGVRLVLYPHAETVMETLEESLAFLDGLAARGHPEVLTSINVCHERLAGRGGRLPELVSRAGKRLGLVSINGAGVGARSILPLDRGTFDLHPFLEALSRSGYSGPVALHTFLLPMLGTPEYDRHLQRSLAWWRSNVVD